jgi:ferredoxin
MVLLNRMVEIFIENIGGSIQASPAVSVLNNLLQAGIKIAHRCGGKAQCGTCRYMVLQGGDNISPPGEIELAKLTAMGNPVNTRLGCQRYPFGDVSIRIVLLNEPG